MKYYLIQKLLSCRLHLALATLALLLQRSPILKLIANAKNLQFSSPAVRIVQAFTLPAAALSLPHAVSGASSSTYTVKPSNSPTAAVGELTAFTFEISIDPKSWSVQGDIPPGLRITDLSTRREELTDRVITTKVGIITGTPTQPGTYELTLTPWGNDDGTGDSAPGPLDLTIVITGEAMVPEAPTLSFQRSDSILKLSWQPVEGADFELEESEDLDKWDPINTPQSNGTNQSEADLPLPEAKGKFYRLALKAST